MLAPSRYSVLGLLVVVAASAALMSAQMIAAVYETDRVVLGGNVSPLARRSNVTDCNAPA